MVISYPIYYFMFMMLNYYIWHDNESIHDKVKYLTETEKAIMCYHYKKIYEFYDPITKSDFKLIYNSSQLENLAKKNNVSKKVIIKFCKEFYDNKN